MKTKLAKLTILFAAVLLMITGCFFFANEKEEKAMLGATKIGDEILTIGGIYGKIVAVKEESYVIETGPERAKIKIAKWAMQQNFTKNAELEAEKAKAKEKKSKPVEK